MEEIWDLYDKNKQVVGVSHTRGDDIPEGCYHLVVHVWIRNSRGEYLITRRAANRKSYPLLYECVGGSVLADETSAEGAVREVVEEVGLVFKTTDGKIIKTEVRDFVGDVKFADILDAWLFEYDGEVDLSKATTDEVDSVQWLSIEKVKAYDKKFSYVLMAFGVVCVARIFWCPMMLIRDYGQYLIDPTVTGRLGPTIVGDAMMNAYLPQSGYTRAIMAIVLLSLSAISFVVSGVTAYFKAKQYAEYMHGKDVSKGV